MASTVIKNLATNYIIDKTTKDNNNKGIEDIIDKATRDIISMASEDSINRATKDSNKAVEDIFVRTVLIRQLKRRQLKTIIIKQLKTWIISQMIT